MSTASLSSDQGGVDGGDLFLDYRPSHRPTDVRRQWAALRRHARLAGTIILAALLVGLAATLLMTPRYRAVASVQIDQQAERVLRTEDEQAPALPPDTDRFLQTQVDVLNSRATALGVAQRLKLFGNARFAAATRPAGFGSEAGDPRERILTRLRDKLDIDLPRNSRVVRIGFTSADPRVSATVANAFAAAFIAGNLRRRYDSSAYARGFLGRQLEAARLRVERSERALNAYARGAGLVPVGRVVSRASTPGDGSPSLTGASLGQLNDALNAAKATRIAAEARYRAAGPGAPLGQALANPAIQELLRQRAEKAAALRVEQIRHRDDYPSVREVRGQLAELDGQIEGITGSIRGAIGSDYRAAARQERALAGEVARLREATLGEQDRGVRSTILAREADTSRALYDALLQQFKEASAAAGVGTSNLSVVDVAEPPARPASPRPLFNLALALLAGVVVAAGAVLLREGMDDAIRTPDEIVRDLALPLLGTIPPADPGGTAIGEAAAAVLAALKSAPGGPPRSLLVTSAAAGEGKSTAACAIARSAARSGLSVLLIDADLRRPALHTLLGVANVAGLSDALREGRIGPDPQRLADGLWFLGSGAPADDPAGLLASKTLAPLLSRLRDRHDLIVLDGPPVLGLADAPLLAAQVEATLLIIEAERSSHAAAVNAVQRLRASGASLAGALLNRFDPRRAGLGHVYGVDHHRYGSAR